LVEDEDEEETEEVGLINLMGFIFLEEDEALLEVKGSSERTLFSLTSLLMTSVGKKSVFLMFLRM